MTIIGMNPDEILFVIEISKFKRLAIHISQPKCKLKTLSLIKNPIFGWGHVIDAIAQSQNSRQPILTGKTRSN
jgi:hypothetical protein